MPGVQYMTFAFLPVSGRFAPPSQKGKTGYAFLFSLAMDKNEWPPLTNVPFTTGKPVCSECPPTHPYAENGLCIDVKPRTKPK
jgi:hypothetical protein